MTYKQFFIRGIDDLEEAFHVLDILSDSASLIDEDNDADPDLDFVPSINEIPNETSEDVSSEDDAPEPSTSSRGRSRVRASKRV